MCVAVQSHVERYFRDIAQVTDVVVMEVAVSVALAWDLVGCTPFDFLSQLCGLVPPEAAQGLFGIPDAHTLGRVLLKESVGLARLAASGWSSVFLIPAMPIWPLVLVGVHSCLCPWVPVHHAPTHSAQPSHTPCVVHARFDDAPVLRAPIGSALFLVVFPSPPALHLLFLFIFLATGTDGLCLFPLLLAPPPSHHRLCPAAVRPV